MVKLTRRKSMLTAHSNTESKSSSSLFSVVNKGGISLDDFMQVTASQIINEVPQTLVWRERGGA